MAAGQWNLARHLWLGEGVVKDLTESYEWTRKAAEQDVAAAQNRLAFVFRGARSGAG